MNNSQNYLMYDFLTAAFFAAIVFATVMKIVDAGDNKDTHTYTDPNEVM